jgi:hypothetical protein
VPRSTISSDVAAPPRFPRILSIIDDDKPLVHEGREAYLLELDDGRWVFTALPARSFLDRRSAIARRCAVEFIDEHGQVFTGFDLRALFRVAVTQLDKTLAGLPASRARRARGYAALLAFAARPVVEMAS